jgi:VIT1/CCC1 family predicted Fe2+/Mn2+ transporter
MGIAASLSMGATSYLSTKAEGGEKEPFKASVYTSAAYLLAVLLLVLPFWLLGNIYISLALTIFSAVVVIFIFTFYISVAKGIPFKERFVETVLISVGVAALSFAIGYLVRIFLNVQI